MKTSHCMTGLLLAGLLAFAGCGKSEKPAPVESSVQIIDATSFRPAFESASPQIKALVNDTMMSIQGVAYQKALADLDKLAGLPDLTEAQKKVVADLSEQVKKKMAQLAN